MSRNQSELKRRQLDIVAALRRVRDRNPKWRYECVVEEVAREFYLSPSTIVKEVKKQYD